jgi:hypothetical protein
MFVVSGCDLGRRLFPDCDGGRESNGVMLLWLRDSRSDD